MRRPFRILLCLILGLVALATPAAATSLTSAAHAPTASAPYCGIYWGSLSKTVQTSSQAPLTNVRTGRHACFDRVVLDVRGDVHGYSVRYVNTVRQPATGWAVPLRGGAALEINAFVPTYNHAGHPTYRPVNPNELRNVRGYRTFRQLALAGSFEGQTTVGVGIRARLPFRVFILDGPGTGSRLVVDVAHRW